VLAKKFRGGLAATAPLSAPALLDEDEMAEAPTAESHGSAATPPSLPGAAVA